jgi:hypothetical protein
MEGHDRAGLQRDDRWRSARLPAAAAGLVLVELALMDEVGSPVTLLRDLGDLGRSWADPVAPVLAVIALLTDTLIAYVLVVLLLHSLCMLPGFMGRFAGRLMSLVAPATVQRLLELLVGGALLAQVALATAPGAPPGHRWGGSDLASTASLAVSGSVGPASLGGLATTRQGEGWLRWPLDSMEPAGARPTSRRSAAPLPPWLGGGPSNTAPSHGDEGNAGGTAAPGHVVEVGDTLWDIAAARLAPGERPAANVHRYWRQIYRANRSAIGADPDLILPGTRLDVPPFRRARR